MAAAHRDDRLDGDDAAHQHQHRVSAFFPGLHLDPAAVYVVRRNPTPVPKVIALVCIAGAFVHVSFGPDYLGSHTSSFRRQQVYWQIDDIDWGQGLKQTRQWIDSHARDGRPIAIWYFGPRKVGLMRHYLGDKVTLLEASTSGRPIRPACRRKSQRTAG